MKKDSIHERLLDSIFEKAEKEARITITIDCEPAGTEEKVRLIHERLARVRFLSDISIPHWYD